MVTKHFEKGDGLKSRGILPRNQETLWAYTIWDLRFSKVESKKNKNKNNLDVREHI